MKFTNLTTGIVFLLLVTQVLFGGLYLYLQPTPKATAQMMGPGMMGPGTKTGGGFFNTFPYATGNRSGLVPISPLIGQAIASRIHVSLSNASLIAEKAVGNDSHAVSGGLGTHLGYLTYIVWVADSNYRTLHMVIVDAANGKVLSNQPLFGNTFGMMGPGMMMYRGTPYPNVLTNPTGATTPSGVIVSIVADAQDMGDKAFQPNPISIRVGNTVTWVNDDTVMHTITSGNGSNDPSAARQFDSGLLAEGQTFTHTFKTAGQFNYFCEPHPDMVGEVIVK